MIESIQALCIEAGRLILDLYHADPQVALKEDQSPLTRADLAAHEFLLNALGQLTPSIPVVSEEGLSATAIGPLEEYWLVDPLDGTKEFLRRSGDFTVNIALIRQATPVYGIVYAPVRQLAFFARRNAGAWRQDRDSPPVSIRTAPTPDEGLRVVASRDHAGPEIAVLQRRLPAVELKSMGSSLKFCLVAEGEADFYPRLAPTMEWDTAAAQCVVESAGGAVLTLDGKPLTYGKEGRRNPPIVTVGNPAADWPAWLDLR